MVCLVLLNPIHSYTVYLHKLLVYECNSANFCLSSESINLIQSKHAHSYMHNE